MIEPLTPEREAAASRLIAIIRGGDAETQAEDWLADYAADLREALADAKRELLASLIEEWQTGKWIDAPKRSDRIAERIATGQFVLGWLKKKLGEIDSPGNQPTEGES